MLKRLDDIKRRLEAAKAGDADASLSVVYADVAWLLETVKTLNGQLADAYTYQQAARQRVVALENRARAAGVKV